MHNVAASCVTGQWACSYTLYFEAENKTCIS